MTHKFNLSADLQQEKVKAFLEAATALGLTIVDSLEAAITTPNTVFINLKDKTIQIDITARQPLNIEIKKILHIGFSIYFTTENTRFRSRHLLQ